MQNNWAALIFDDCRHDISRRLAELQAAQIHDGAYDGSRAVFPMAAEFGKLANAALEEALADATERINGPDRDKKWRTLTAAINDALESLLSDAPGILEQYVSRKVHSNDTIILRALEPELSRLRRRFEMISTRGLIEDPNRNRAPIEDLGVFVNDTVERHAKGTPLWG